MPTEPAARPQRARRRPRCGPHHDTSEHILDGDDIGRNIYSGYGFASPGTRRTYNTYWAAWLQYGVTGTQRDRGQRHRSPPPRLHRSRRHSARCPPGQHAAENLIAARAVYNRAIADGPIDPRSSPAHRVSKPRRLPSTRRALIPHELTAITDTARTTGNDVILDPLPLRLHTETAARRGDALAPRLIDLDEEHCLVLLAGEGRHHPLATHQPTTHSRLGRPRSMPRSHPANGCFVALSRQPPVHQSPLRPAMAPHRPTAALGRTPLRVRHRPRLHRPYRHHRTSHHHIHQSQPPRHRHRPIRHDRTPTPVAHHDNPQP